MELLPGWTWGTQHGESRGFSPGKDGAEGWINLSCTSVELGWGGSGAGELSCGFLCFKRKKKPNINLGKKFETEKQVSLDLAKRRKHHFHLIHWQSLKLKPI